MKKKIGFIFLLISVGLFFESAFPYGFNVWTSGPFNLNHNQSRNFNLPELGEGNYQLWVRASNPEICAIFKGTETRAPKPGSYLPSGYRPVSVNVLSGNNGNFSVYSGNRISGGNISVCYGCCRKLLYGQQYPAASIEIGISKN